MRKLLSVLGVVTMLAMCLVAATPVMAQVPGASYSEETIAVGDIYVDECFAYPTNNGAWKCLEVDGADGAMMLIESVAMGPTLMPEGDPPVLVDAGGGWIDTLEFVDVIAGNASIDAAIVVGVCKPDKLGNWPGEITDQVSAFHVAPAPGNEAVIVYEMTAMEIVRDTHDGTWPTAYVGSIFVESYSMANEGGLTQRYLSMSGQYSNSFVTVDQTVVGVYEGFGAFSEIDMLAADIPPDWWEFCPPVIFGP